MLEILVLIVLTRRIGTIVEPKGYKSGGYKLLAVLLWFGGEILGAIIGAVIARRDESAQCLIYLIALTGAAIGGFIAYAIAKARAQAGSPLLTGSIGKLPVPAIILLWLMSNVLARTSGYFTFSWVNPSYEQSLFVVANIAAGLADGMIAGLLQWLILLVVIPNANRWILAGWVLATTLGSAIAIALAVFTPLTTIVVFFIISAVSGLVFGFLQWLILQRFSKTAIWWIPANVVDGIAGWIAAQLILSSISGNVVFGLITGVIGSIASSIALVFILTKNLADSKSVSDHQPLSAPIKIEPYVETQSTPGSSQPYGSAEKVVSEMKGSSSAAEKAIDHQVELWQKMGFTVGGVEAAKEEVRRAEAARPNEAWFDETVDKLVSIYRAHPQGFVKGTGGASEGQLRQLGEMLHEKGGMDLMLAAHREFSSRCGIYGAPRNLEIMWDGIGPWMG
ncbi:MAG TPA: hypothetical protein VK206_16760 [Anaerolineales bacterium]|nr:hypothetical protein [Anaerolineales bacterium]HLO27726.1 hypothetical protein [Anaerolineales bacterium]